MLSVVSLEEAKRIILESGLSFERKPEKVKLSEAVGRILFYDICSCENIPAFNRSTVDGFAVKASDTFGSSESIPAQLTVKGEILMGEEAAISIYEGECAFTASSFRIQNSSTGIPSPPLALFIVMLSRPT